MPYNLSRFGFGEMMDCRGRIRDLFADDPATLEEAAERAVEFFHRELVDEHVEAHGKSALPLRRRRRDAARIEAAGSGEACGPLLAFDPLHR